MDAKWTLSLLAAILHTVASAPESVFALEGNSVTLTMQRHNIMDIDKVVWGFNQSCDVISYYPHYNKSRQLRIPDPYKGRVEFDFMTFSLELTNLQKNDSGVYKGEINIDGKTDLSEYRLNVLDVTICNHSNPLSWPHATVELETLCQSTQQQEFPLGDEQTLIWICAPVASGLVLLVLGGVLCFRMHSKNQASSSSDVYQSVENALALSPVKGPSPIYSKVQSHTGPNTDLETPQPEHVYSFVP